MRQTEADRSLLELVASRLHTQPHVLMERYYGTAADAHEQMEEFGATGVLQASFAQALRRELRWLDQSAEHDPIPVAA